MQLEKFKVSMESAVAKQLKCAEQAQRDTCYLLVIYTLGRKAVLVHRIDATPLLERSSKPDPRRKVVAVHRIDATNAQHVYGLAGTVAT